MTDTLELLAVLREKQYGANVADTLTRWDRARDAAADTIEALTAERDALRADAETTSAALSAAWVREATAIAERDAALEACNQARLAFGGYVSAQSAITKLDAALSDNLTCHKKTAV